MKHERFAPEIVDTDALYLTVRRSVALPVGRAFGGVIACSTAAGLAGLLVTDAPDVRAVAVALLGALAVGGVAATIATRGIAARISRALALPVELLLSQIVAAGDTVPEGLHCLAGRPLHRRQVEADLALLARSMRGVERQSRSIVAELADAQARADQ